MSSTDARVRIRRDVSKFHNDIGGVNHVAITSLGLRKVGKIANEFYEEKDTFRDSSVRITDQDWESATRALLQIEEEIEKGKKLIQQFFRNVTDSTVDFYS